jgi:hypothetical protein
MSTPCWVLLYIPSWATDSTKLFSLRGPSKQVKHPENGNFEDFPGGFLRMLVESVGDGGFDEANEGSDAQICYPNPIHSLFSGKM